MTSTANQPGYGVKPLAGNSFDDHLNFAGDYLQARSRSNGGSLERALASYGDGDGYARQVMARLPGARPVVAATAPAQAQTQVAALAPVPIQSPPMQPAMQQTIPVDPVAQQAAALAPPPTPPIEMQQAALASQVPVQLSEANAWEAFLRNNQSAPVAAADLEQYGSTMPVSMSRAPDFQAMRQYAQPDIQPDFRPISRLKARI